MRMGKLVALCVSVAVSGCATLFPPIQSAVDSGDPKRVEAALNEGQDINGTFGQLKRTPLMEAAAQGKYEVAQFLLARGADVNARRSGTSALSLACIRGDKKMVELLLSKGAEVARRELEWAAGPDKTAIAALLTQAQSGQRKAVEAAKGPAFVVASDVDEPSYKLAERPDDFALVVGIDSYMDGPAARFAERDAAAIKRHLIALGWPERNVVLLLGKDAGRAGLERYLERWLPNNVTPNSRFAFYFAGAGAADSSRLAYLLPWDGDEKHSDVTGYSLARLYQKIAALKARSALIVVDAVLPEDADPAGGKLADGAALIARRAPAESGEHGAASLALLKGLNGAALDQNGSVTLRGLEAYLRVKLGAQAPRLLTGGLGESDLKLR